MFGSGFGEFPNSNVFISRMFVGFYGKLLLFIDDIIFIGELFKGDEILF